MVEKVGTYRWRILALLFMATTINYMDRSILGVLGPTLRDHVFSWSNQQYAWINMSFNSNGLSFSNSFCCSRVTESRRTAVVAMIRLLV